MKTEDVDTMKTMLSSCRGTHCHEIDSPPTNLKTHTTLAQKPILNPSSKLCNIELEKTSRTDDPADANMDTKDRSKAP